MASFAKVAGEDKEVDAYELADVLNLVLKNGILFIHQL